MSASPNAAMNLLRPAARLVLVGILTGASAETYTFTTQGGGALIAGAPDNRGIPASARPTGTPGSEGRAGNVARFFSPISDAVDGGGTSYVSDDVSRVLHKGAALAAPPFTVTAPQPRQVNLERGASFTFAVTGSGFSYRWKKDGAAIAG